MLMKKKHEEYTTLIIAAEKVHSHLAKFLIQEGFGLTTLMFAARNKDIEC